MRVVIDTNVLIQMFGALSPLAPLRKALQSGLLGTVVRTNPTFHFQVITAHQDDNIFADAAICASAGFVVTEDRHFAGLRTAGFKPQPITPGEFIRLCLPPQI